MFLYIDHSHIKYLLHYILIYDIVIFLMFFYDIGYIFDNHCLNILFITIWVNFLDQNWQVKSEIFHKLGLHLID